MARNAAAALDLSGVGCWKGRLRRAAPSDRGLKRFLVTIGDRTVGGLNHRDQMVGPWQVPVADCA